MIETTLLTIAVSALAKVSAQALSRAALDLRKRLLQSDVEAVFPRVDREILPFQEDLANEQGTLDVLVRADPEVDLESVANVIASWLEADSGRVISIGNATEVRAGDLDIAGKLRAAIDTPTSSS